MRPSNKVTSSPRLGCTKALVQQDSLIFNSQEMCDQSKINLGKSMSEKRFASQITGTDRIPMKMLRFSCFCNKLLSPKDSLNQYSCFKTLIYSLQHFP